MSRLNKNNNTNENNNRVMNNNTRESEVRIEPSRKSATDKAREAAAREQEREARKAEREQRLADAKKFDELTMSPNDAMRAVAAHAHDELREGFTVADYMATFGMKKLDVKSLRKALPSAFVREDGVYMPTTHAATYDSGTPEDERNGKAVYYCVTKGVGQKAHKVWKKAQTYGFERVDLWTPSIVRRLLAAGMTYADKADDRAKRNVEVKNCKQFYVMSERKESAINGKAVHRKSVIEDYVAIDSKNVKWAE